MRILIVYDSVSTKKLTEQVAETISQTLKENGLEVDSVLAKDASKTNVRDYDCLIVGSPTMGWRPTDATMQFLKALPDDGFIKKFGAAFDTQIKSVFSGNGTKALEKRLKELGFEIITPALVAYVQGKSSQMRLKDGEVEKTKGWAQNLVKTAQNLTRGMAE